MVKKIKGYLLFTSLVYRIIMFGVLPLVFGGGYIAAAAVKMDGAFLLTMILMIPTLLVLMEIFADNWMFGGIQDRDGAKMDFLKTSPKGMKLLENALVLDLVRRLVTLSVIMAVCFLANMAMGIEMFGGDAVKEAGVLAGLALASYTLSVLGTLITRFFSWFWGNCLVGNVAMYVNMFCCGGLLRTEKLIALNCVFALLAAGATVLAVKAAMGRVRGGYYDK